MHVNVDAGAGMSAGKAHLLDDVIGKLSTMGHCLGAMSTAVVPCQTQTHALTQSWGLMLLLSALWHVIYKRLLSQMRIAGILMSLTCSWLVCM